MGRLVRIIKKIFGKQVVINPIYNPYVYKNNQESFCGGTLDGEKLLIVTNIDENTAEFNMMQQSIHIERALYTVKNVSSESFDIQNESNIEPYKHIINVIKFTDKDSSDSVEKIYQLLQKEVEYMISCNASEGNSICTVVISDDTVLLCTLKTLIKGLGYTLGNHGIINNGIVSEHKAPFEGLFHTAIYMSSKFGHILSGEVIEFR
ncbi:MAG: hypothetical protein HDQ95_05485 [Roseburia sp.]|nr:hypothetical protein [Roseburia sp.]